MQAPYPPAASPDALLIQRIAGLADRAALAELDARHGMTLYALAYSMVLNGDAADRAVAHSFREIWRSAASFDARRGTVQRWLSDLTRAAALRQRLRTEAHRPGPVLGPAIAPPRRPSALPRARRPVRWVAGLASAARVATIVVLALLLR